MTYRTSNREQTAPRDAENARFAVEALFETRPTIDEKPSDVEVIVRRRRLASADSPVYGNDSEQGGGAAVRAPRVFKLEKRPQSNGNGGPRLSSAVSHSDGDEGTSSAPGLAKAGRRRRRRLNGDVTIIHPQMRESHAAGEQLSGESAEQDVLCVQEEAGGVGMFGTDPAEQRRYEALMAKIAGLERQAVAAKRREAAVAIRWIRKAIRDYGIGAQELDFET